MLLRRGSVRKRRKMRSRRSSLKTAKPEPAETPASSSHPLEKKSNSSTKTET